MHVRLPRVALKTITYGLMHPALAIGVTEPVVQTFAFAAHERLWARFGRRPASVAET
jgi:uncharacterized membrane protein